MGTMVNSSDYLSAHELYFIITGATTKNQQPLYQQLAHAVGPLDSNTLEIGQNVLLSTQENINFIHEIFRQVRQSKR